MQNSLSKVQKTDPLGYTDLLLDLNCRSSSTQRRTAVNRQQITVRKAHNRQQASKGRGRGRATRKKERKVQVGKSPKRRRWRRRRTAGGVSWCCSRMAAQHQRAKKKKTSESNEKKTFSASSTVPKSACPLCTSICPLWKS